MSLVQLNRPQQTQVSKFSLFELGFRLFFFGAAVFSVLSIASWMLAYAFQFTPSIAPLNLFQWHAHQMIYGFSVAVIAGFLLTAIMNWTGRQTLRRGKLVALFLCWSIPRVLLLFGTAFLEAAALFDLLFMLGLLIATVSPVWAVRQRRQLIILAKVGLLAFGNLSFYLGVFGVLQHGIFWGIYGGLFVIVSLILLIGARVVPMFIENCLDKKVKVKNPFWVVIANLFLFLVFAVNELFFTNTATSLTSAGALFIVNSYRLVLWHRVEIWQHPLLWGLYCAFLAINFGFFLYIVKPIFQLSPFIGVHAFAYGGIGFSTVAMMCRVTLGHTGRSVRKPPKGTFLIHLLLVIGGITRVVMPLFDQSHYLVWIVTSQILWVLAFSGYLILYSPMLFAARVDGAPG